MLRLFCVYVTLLVLMLCLNGNVFGTEMPNSIRTSKVSLESIQLKKGSSELPVFGNYFADARLFNGDLSSKLTKIESLLKVRTQKLAQFQAEYVKELQKLREEHRVLMSKQEAHSESQSSEWAISLYDNIARQAVLKQSVAEKTALWDKENYIQVKSIEKDGKRFLVDLEVQRKAISRQASIASSLE